MRINVKTRPNEMGYELSCCRPIAYDLNYATRLGLGVYKLFKEGITGCMVTVDRTGDILPFTLRMLRTKRVKLNQDL